MRRKRDLSPNRYRTINPSGSNKFVSPFSQKVTSDGIVEKRDRSYNWTGYKVSLLFTIIIGFFSYLLIDYLMF